jgi:hypothetical protein
MNLCGLKQKFNEVCDRKVVILLGYKIFSYCPIMNISFPENFKLVSWQVIINYSVNLEQQILGK